MPSVDNVMSNKDQMIMSERSEGGGGGGHQSQSQPLFVMNSLADRTSPQSQQYLSSESLEDRNSHSSTESPTNVVHRKDHEFIPTRMKTISSSKPAADPKQFTRIPSNPLLVSAQKQLTQVSAAVEEVKKKKEVVRRGDDEPDWQMNLSSWKDRRRKQSEDALQRVTEVKALESDGDDSNQKQRISIGRKLSSLMYTNGEEDWSDLGLEKTSPNLERAAGPPDTLLPVKKAEAKKRTSLPTGVLGSTVEPNVDQPDDGEDPSELVRSASRTPMGGGEFAGYGEGVPVLNRKISAPVLPYGSPKGAMYEMGDGSAPAVRRKSSELSTTMKTRLEAFTNVQEPKGEARMVEPDETFREKLKTFRKISEPQPEEDLPKGPKAPLSYQTLIGSTFSQSNSRTLDNDEHEEDNDSVDQLLDAALEESYRSVLEEETEKKSSSDILTRPTSKSPPTEKPPPPPVTTATNNTGESAKNRKNLQLHRPPQGGGGEDIDIQEQEIIASLAKEEREHKRYMETVSAMRNLSPGGASSTSSPHSDSVARLAPQPYNKKAGTVSPILRTDSPAAASEPQSNAPVKKKSDGQSRSYNQQHWLIQEAEQRRISEQQMRQQQSPGGLAMQPSPVYENSQYIGGMPTHQHIPPNQYTNHQRQTQQFQQQYTPPVAPQQQQQQQHHQVPVVPPPSENMYANLGQQPPLPSSFQQRDVMPPVAGIRGLPGPQVPPRNSTADGTSATSGGGSSDRLLSVSGKKKCSHCKEELGRGAAMIIESLRLFYHLRCFRCVVCHVQLGNGASGTDVRVRNNKLHCQNCYSNDEGLKFSKV